MPSRFGLRHGGLATLGLLVSLVAGVLLGLATPPVAAGAALPRVSAQSVAADVQTLYAGVAYGGQVRVEVRLCEDAVAALDQEAIEHTVQDLLFALPEGSYTALPRVQGAPSFALDVDAAALDTLLASPLVSVTGTATMARIHDRDQDRQRRLPCPEELAAASETARPFFCADGTQIEWHRPDQDQPVIVPNRLLTTPAGGAGPSF